jgi:hypothetical protein
LGCAVLFRGFLLPDLDVDALIRLLNDLTLDARFLSDSGPTTLAIHAAVITSTENPSAI